MKKIIITLFAAILSVVAFAKTQEELIAEFKALPDGMKVRQDWAMENKQDILKIWNTWKVSDIAKSDNGLEAKAANDNGVLRAIFAKLCDNCYDEMAPIPDLAYIRICCWNIVKYRNSDWYNQLKANNFVIEGIDIGNDLGNGYKYFLAEIFGDDDTIMTLPEDKCVDYASYPRIVARSLLAASNIEEAKIKINKIKMAYIVKGREVPITINAVSKELTSRLLDSKIVK